MRNDQVMGEGVGLTGPTLDFSDTPFRLSVAVAKKALNGILLICELLNCSNMIRNSIDRYLSLFGMIVLQI